MKQSFYAKSAVCILMCLAVSTAFAQMPQPFSADMSTVSNNGNLNMSGKVFFALPHMRIDMNNTGQAKGAGPFGGKMSMIVDGTNKMMYMIMTDQHMYMEFPTDKDTMMSQRLPKFQDLLKSSDPCSVTGNEGTTCKKIGNEAIDGRPCEKWEMTNKSGKVSTFWMDQKLHFPIKMVDSNITTQYTNIKEGAQDPALFKVPDGFQKFDASAFGQRPH